MQECWRANVEARRGPQRERGVHGRRRRLRGRGAHGERRAGLCISEWLREGAGDVGVGIVCMVAVVAAAASGWYALAPIRFL
jgi:hypothetical protein